MITQKIRLPQIRLRVGPTAQAVQRSVTARVFQSVSLVVVVMTLSTLYIGPGLGVEANYVTMQTNGKTLLATVKDMVHAARMFIKPGV